MILKNESKIFNKSSVLG